MNNIKDQYDELRIREHYQGLLDGGMTEDQASVKMLYDSPFSMDNVNMFLDGVKKKDNPKESFGGPIKNTSNQNLSGGSTLASASGGTTTASPSVPFAEFGGSETKPDAYTFASEQDVIEGETIRKTPVRTEYKPKQYDVYTQMAMEAFMRPFHTFNTSDYGIGRPEFTAFGDAADGAGQGSMTLFDIYNEAYEEVVMDVIKEKLPNAYDRVAAYKQVAESNHPETAKQDMQNYQYVSGMTKGLLIREVMTETLMKEFTPEQIEKGGAKIEKSIYENFGLKVDLNRDNIVGDGTSAFSDYSNALGIGFTNWKHGLKILPFNITEGLGLEDPDIPYSAWAADFMIPETQSKDMTREEIAREYEKIMDRRRSERQVPYMTDEELSYYMGEANVPISRQTIVGALESAPQTLYWMAAAAASGKGGPSKFFSPTFKAKGVPFLVSTLGMGAQVYSDVYDKTFMDEEFHYYVNSQGVTVPRSQAVDLFGNTLPGFERKHDTHKAQGYAVWNGLNEGVSEGAGLVMFGVVGGYVSKAMTNPLARTALERWIAGTMVGIGIEGASELTEEQLAEAGQFVIDKVYKEQRPISELGQWLTSPELEERMTAAGNVGFTSGLGLSGAITTTTNVRNANKGKQILQDIGDAIEEEQRILDRMEADDLSLDLATTGMEGEGNQAARDQIIADQQALLEARAKKKKAQAEAVAITLSLGSEVSKLSGNREKLNEIVNEINKSSGATRQSLMIKLRDELGRVEKEDYATYELLNDAFELLNNNKEFSAEVAYILGNLIDDVRTSRMLRAAATRSGGAGKAITESMASEVNQRISDSMKTLEKYMDGRGVEYTLILPGENVTDATTITKVSTTGETSEILVRQEGKEQVEAGAEETTETEDRYIFEDSKAVELLGSRVMSEEQMAELSKLMNTLKGDYRVVFHKDPNALGGNTSALARMNEQGQIFEIHLTRGSSIRDIQEEFVHTRFDALLRENDALRANLINEIESLAAKNEELADAVRRYAVGYSDVTETQRQREVITNLMIDLADGTLSAGLTQKVKKAFGVSDAQELLSMVEETKGLLTGKRNQESERVTRRSKELVEAVETTDSGLEARGQKYDPDWIKGKNVRFTVYYNGRSDQYNSKVKDYGHFRNLWVRVTGNGQRQMRIDIEDPNSAGGYSLIQDMPGHSRGRNQPLNWYGSGAYIKKDKETGEPVAVEPIAFTLADKMSARRKREAREEQRRKERARKREQNLYTAARELGYQSLDDVAPRQTSQSWDYSRTHDELDLIEATILKEKGVMVIPNTVDEVYDIPKRALKELQGPGRNPVKSNLLYARDLDMESNEVQLATFEEVIEFALKNAPGGLRVITTDYSPTRSGQAEARFVDPYGARRRVSKEKTFLTTGVGYQDASFLDPNKGGEFGGVVSSHVAQGGSNFRLRKITESANNDQWVLVVPRMLTYTSNDGDPGVYRGLVSSVYEMLISYTRAANNKDPKRVRTDVIIGNQRFHIDDLSSAIVENLINKTQTKETRVKTSEGKTLKEQSEDKYGESLFIGYFAQMWTPEMAKMSETGPFFNRKSLEAFGFVVPDDPSQDIKVNTRVIDKETGLPLAVRRMFDLLMSEQFYHDDNASFTARKYVSAALHADAKVENGKIQGGLAKVKNESGQYIFEPKKAKGSNKGSMKAWLSETFGLIEGKEFTSGKGHRAYLIDTSGKNYAGTLVDQSGRVQEILSPGQKAQQLEGQRVDYRYQVVVKKAAIIELTDRPGEKELKDETYDDGRPGMDFIYLGVQARRLGRISQTGGDHWNPSEPTPFGAATDAISIKLQDKYSDVIHLQRDVEEYNRTRRQNQDFDLAVDLMYGKNRYDLEFLESYLDDIKADMKLNNISSDDLSNYLYARHAQERNSFIASRRDDLDAGSGMTNDEAIQILNDLDSREMRALADMVYAIIEDTRQTYIDFGLETQETVDAWRSLYDYYVPLQGMSEDESDVETTSYPTGGAGMSVYGSMSRKAKGRKGKTDTNIIAQVVMQNAMAHTAARKNEALKSMYDLVKGNPNPNVWRIHNEQNPMMRTDIDGKQRPMSAAEMRASRNTVPVRIDGKQEFIYFKDPSYAATLNGMSIDQQNIITRALRVPAGFLRNVFTIYDPNFFVSNFARDIQAAVYNATAEAEQQNGAVYGANSAKLTKDIIANTSTALRAMLNEAAFGKEMSPEMAAMLEEWKSMGGQTGWGYHDDIEAITKDLRKATTDDTLTDKIFATPKTFFRYVEGVNEAFENSIRFAAYMAAKQNGATPERAAQLAKNITVNFNRSGEWGTTLNSIYLFFNAAMQGNARLLKSVVMGKDNPIQVTDQDVAWINRVSTPQKIAFGMALFSGLQTMINLAISGDDEDGEKWYNKIPDYEKERNIIIMAPNGKNYFKIPIPYGYNIFNNLGVTIAETSSGHRDVDEAFLFMATSAVSSFSPISFGQSKNAVDYMTKAVVPTALKPFVEVGYNETYFGSQVYQEQFPFGTERPNSDLAFRSPEWMQDMFVTINEMTGGSKYKSGDVDINPDPYWYLFEYFIGGAGKFVNQSGDLAVDGYRSVDRVVSEVSNAANSDEAFDAVMNSNNYSDISLTKVPIVKRMYGEPSRYYDFDLFTENINTVMQLEKERKEAPKPGAGDRYKGISTLAVRAKDAQKLLSRVRDMKSRARDIEDPLKRSKEMNRLMEEERLLVVRFNKMFDEIRGEN